MSIEIPRDSTTQTKLKNEALAANIMTPSNQFFQQGDNLVFDLIYVDSFNNHVQDYDFSSGASASFEYDQKKFTLSKTIILGKVLFYANEADNESFRALPPR